ncbi:MAG TPA: PRC-barrel domain-containing protein [Bacillus sp. (in: firmicutes)]|nr:PRC-barrel domain-containing protein [Bacillus sp. (in: firmicutes)]
MSSDADVGDESGSRIGPTILWSMLKGKKVITNDGKDIGEIKDISDNYIRLEKGSIKK